MEALRENPSVAKKVFRFLFPFMYHPNYCEFQIVEVREETRAKKKQMAMAMRQKQLGEMGMKVCRRCRGMKRVY